MKTLNDSAIPTPENIPSSQDSPAMPSKNPSPGHHPAPIPARAWVALTVAMLAVSSSSIFVRYAMAPALAKAAWRMTLATAVVLPFAFAHSGGELRRLTRAHWFQAALSGIFLAFHFATWIASLDYTTVVSSTLLAATTPVWVALLAPWLTGDRLRACGWLGVGLALSGAAMTSLGEVAISGRAFRGDLLALTGGVMAALYMMMGRRLRRQVGLLTYASVTYGCSAAVLWGLVALTGTHAWGFTPGTWGALFGMALLCQHLGHSGYNYALHYVSPGIISVLLLSEPVLSGLAAWFCFGEVPTLRLAFAAALLMPGIWLVARDQQQAHGCD